MVETIVSILAILVIIGGVIWGLWFEYGSRK